MRTALLTFHLCVLALSATVEAQTPLPNGDFETDRHWLFRPRLQEHECLDGRAAGAPAFSTHLADSGRALRLGHDLPTRVDGLDQAAVHRAFSSAEVFDEARYTIVSFRARHYARDDEQFFALVGSRAEVGRLPRWDIQGDGEWREYRVRADGCGPEAWLTFVVEERRLAPGEEPTSQLGIQSTVLIDDVDIECSTDRSVRIDADPPLEGRSVETSVCFGAPCAVRPRDGVDGFSVPPKFLRGDVDGTGNVGLTDAIRILNRLFLAGPTFACAAAGDANGNGAHEITDAIYLLNHLFVAGPPLPAPFPECGCAAATGLGCDASPCDG